ncbi:hypothetical protein O1611_g4671 [Lasiodiplodia mahajangana]|uniref:Uncharacterized protein n=1 Tax=Lasiodiplodia mahajangana TaxID=1108764 RepID=A0ACC2JN73_9PEZI|nr:hypothetical protein O1611_g4671 [Lasiodiplodia mahajangana]
MASTIKETFTKFIGFIPGLRRSMDNMNDPSEFEATENPQHWYEDMDVTEGRGLEVQLERQLTEKEKADIFKHFKEVKDEKRKGNPEEAEDDE